MDKHPLEKHAHQHTSGTDPLPREGLLFLHLDKRFGSEQTVSVGASSTQSISKGVYYARTAANTKVEYSYDGGNNWQDLIAASSAGLLISDGKNVRFNNSGASSEDSYLLPII